MKSILLALMLCVAVVSLQAQSPTPDQLLEIYKAAGWKAAYDSQQTPHWCISLPDGAIADRAVIELHKRAKGQPI